jgi:quinol monooxygenase YgiN
MYGLIGKLTAFAGHRDALAAILLEGTHTMPGCLSYVIATDPADPDALWVTEVWDSPASHQASIALPDVKAAIAKGRALIAGSAIESKRCRSGAMDCHSQTRGRRYAAPGIPRPLFVTTGGAK